MNKSTVSAELRSALHSIVSLRLEALLIDASKDAGLHKELQKELSKLSLLVVLTPAPWSKFPYKRTPVPFSAEALAEPTERSKILKIVSEQMIYLLLRDLSEKSVPVLLHLSKDSLLMAVKRLYVNEFTGDRVARLALETAVEKAMEESGVLAAVNKLFK